MLSMKDTITGDDPFYGPREAKCVAPTGHTNAITGPRADHSQPKTSVKDREISRFSASMPARELQWGGQNAQNPVTAHSFIAEKASRATTKRGERAEMAWSNGKNAIFGVKTADLNGAFRPDVVSTRRGTTTYPKWPNFRRSSSVPDHAQ
jgi:hypothetical protein